MNLGIVKDALSVLFKTKEMQVIALLLVIIGIISVSFALKETEVEIKEEIKEEIVDDQKKAISLMKDVEENTEQINVLWKTIVRLENKIEEHEKQRKH